MARSTRLLILIKNASDRRRFLLPVTYFPTNLLYPFTLRVTGIMILQHNDCNSRARNGLGGHNVHKPFENSGLFADFLKDSKFESLE